MATKKKATKKKHPLPETDWVAEIDFTPSPVMRKAIAGAGEIDTNVPQEVLKPTPKHLH